MFGSYFFNFVFAGFNNGTIGRTICHYPIDYCERRRKLLGRKFRRDRNGRSNKCRNRIIRRSLRGGFWQPFFAPTAAMVTVTGRVLAANGAGISNVRVLMTGQTGETQTAVSNTFGNFRFNEVRVGEIYVFTVSSRRYQFSVPSQVLSVNDNVSDLVFIADWQ